MIDLALMPAKEALSGQSPLALFAFEDGLPGPSFLPAPVRKALFARAQEEGFSGKAGETASFSASDGAKARRFLLCGLGRRSELSPEALRRAAASLAKAARRHPSIALVPCRDGLAEAEGLLLASYTYDRYKKPADPARLGTVRLVYQSPGERSRLQAAASRAALAAEAVFYARDLVNEAPSDKTPSSVAERAEALEGSGVEVKILDKGAAEEHGMGALLGVARGSAHEPRLLHLVYKPKRKTKRRIALVGKGVLFDSGGLCLKPREGMEEMKSDMAGAAVVLALFKILPRLGVQAEVHGIAPLAYNMPGCDALKPGDVLKAMDGKTIEVLNTDAEGRLVLADALVYAARLEPEAILDFATLTGAAVIALGEDITAAMTNDRALFARFAAAAKQAGEPLWELPLFAGYRDHIKSKIADLKNMGKPKVAGAIIGGIFLQEFVAGRPWVHLDIAGPSFSGGDSDLGPAGGTGAMVRSTIGYLLSLR
ncbi:MAG TPA: leucyl aminopeptidase [Elusimicrobia bacterium]|nr:leucyl aminopeptidase [Elusimicrobiota bacterium]